MTTAEDEQILVNSVYDHITKVSFDLEHRSRSEEFELPSFLACLKAAIIEFRRVLKMRRDADINILLVDEIAHLVDLDCVRSGKRLTKRNVVDTQRLVFEVALIMLYMEKLKVGLFFSTVEELINEYPEFASRPLEAKVSLLNYRNTMVAALRLIRGSGHKNHLLDLCTRITEGHRVKYKTGSGQTGATSDRIDIFRRESGVVPVKKQTKRRFYEQFFMEPSEQTKLEHAELLTSLANGSARATEAERDDESSHHDDDADDAVGCETKYARNADEKMLCNDDISKFEQIATGNAKVNNSYFIPSICDAVKPFGEFSAGSSGSRSPDPAGGEMNGVKFFVLKPVSGLAMSNTESPRLNDSICHAAHRKYPSTMLDVHEFLSNTKRIEIMGQSAKGAI